MKWIVGMIALLVIVAGCTQQATTTEQAKTAPPPGGSKGEMEQQWTPEEMAAMEKEHAETIIASTHLNLT